MNKPARSTRPARKGGNVRRASPEADLGFWHRPALMNLVADMLYLVAGAMLLAAVWASVQRTAMLPLRQVVVKSLPHNVSGVQIEQSARAALTGNFLTVDLEAARVAFEAIPWVRHADVRRRWPDTIELSVDEHQSVAHWTPHEGESRLVNIFGEVFAADSASALPYFSGPEGTAARVLERFNQFDRGMQAIGRKVVAVQLSPREAWRLRLDDGVTVDLGRDQEKQALEQRLARFVAAYPQLRDQLPVAFNTVDMRYPNGFAVRTDANPIKPDKAES